MNTDIMSVAAPSPAERSARQAEVVQALNPAPDVVATFDDDVHLLPVLLPDIAEKDAASRPSNRANAVEPGAGTMGTPSRLR